MEFSVKNSELNIGDEIIDFYYEFPLHEFLAEPTKTVELDSTVPSQALSGFSLEENTIESQRKELGVDYLTNNDNIAASTCGEIYADNCPVSAAPTSEETTTNIWRLEKNEMDFKIWKTSSPLSIPSTYEGEPIEHENGYNFGTEVNKNDYMNMENVFLCKIPDPNLSSFTQRDDLLQEAPQGKPEEKRFPGCVGLSYSCPDCGKVFRNNTLLKKHKRIHGPRTHTCGECGKAFLDNAKLKRHQLSHTKEKLVPCEFPGCGKRFSLSYNMRVHMLLHTGERPYVCRMNGCNRSFVHPSHLQNHLKKHSQMLSEY